MDKKEFNRMLPQIKTDYPGVVSDAKDIAALNATEFNPELIQRLGSLSAIKLWFVGKEALELNNGAMTNLVALTALAGQAKNRATAASIRQDNTFDIDNRLSEADDYGHVLEFLRGYQASEIPGQVNGDWDQFEERRLLVIKEAAEQFVTMSADEIVNAVKKIPDPAILAIARDAVKKLIIEANNEAEIQKNVQELAVITTLLADSVDKLQPQR